MFNTNYIYIDRKTKSKYVWKKYKSILKGSVLDVGSDECHLKSFLPEDVEYSGIGLGEGPDIKFDLEKGPLPFEDSSFDCVLCLDVLEHLDNIHDIFDELCRVSRCYVVISFPNCWSGFFNMLKIGEYRPGQPMKFYGLPETAPSDRHKWFFSQEEAERFVSFRAKKAGFRIVQEDVDSANLPAVGWRGWIEKYIVRFLFGGVTDKRNLYGGTYWVVLESEKSSQ